jgi:4-amino-4-deoxy-L-arabinose transferase-like glycosyltransferase
MASDSTGAQRLIMAATVVGFALRLAFGFGYWQHRPLTHDEREYLALARSLAQGKGFVYDAPASETGTSQQFGRAPGYPAFLALIGAGREEFDATPARVKLAQSIVGAVGVWLIGLIGYRAAGARAGIAAAAMAAVYPPLVWICSYVLSEALYSTMALASVVLLNLAIDRAEIRRRTAAPLAITAGLAVGFAILVRPVMLLFLPIAALWLIARRRTPIALAVIVAAALVVAPWTLRNARVYHRFVLVASEGGVTFWTGNHPRARGEGDLAANPHIKVADLAFRAEHPEMSAEELEPLYYRDALRYIGGHPLWWIGLLLKKMFYTIVPAGPSYALHSPLYRVVSIASYLLVLPLGVLGAIRWRSRPHPPEALVPLALSAVVVCILFFPQERFRIPVLDPALIVCAGAWYGLRTRETVGM